MNWSIVATFPPPSSAITVAEDNIEPSGDRSCDKDFLTIRLKLIATLTASQTTAGERLEFAAQRQSSRAPSGKLPSTVGCTELKLNLMDGGRVTNVDAWELEHVPDPFDLERQRIRSSLWLTLIFWGSNYLTLTLSTALAGKGHLGAISAVRLGTTALGLGFCYLINKLLSKFSTARKRLIVLALVAPVAAEIFAWAVFFAEAAVDPSLNLSSFIWAGAVRTILFWTWFFLAWAGMYLALSYSFDVREQQRRTAETRELAHLAQLRALHSQINPHFLFNILNSVSALILDGKSERADEMVVKLARFLRLGLAADPTRKIALASEFELQRLYLEIEQQRYEDLRVSFELPEELEEARVPALILQPIVENAVKFGVAGSASAATVSVAGRADDRGLLLEVTDSGGSGEPVKQGSGIGLTNVRQRLELIYGVERIKLAAARRPDGSFRVQVDLPLEFA